MINEKYKPYDYGGPKKGPRGGWEREREMFFVYPFRNENSHSSMRLENRKKKNEPVGLQLYQPLFDWKWVVEGAKIAKIGKNDEKRTAVKPP